MGRFKGTWVWSLVAVAIIGIPLANCGSSSKNVIKLVKPTTKPNPDSIVSRRQHHAGSVEDEENYSEGRPSFGPFPQGFSQTPPRYRFTDEPSDRYDVEESPANNENRGMGFMPEFGPPKGFPDLSKLTGGEFPKMEAPVSSSNTPSFGDTPQYSTYPSGDVQRYRPFPGYPSQGGPNYDDSDDSPTNEGEFGGDYASPSPPSQQNAPRRKPFRGSRPPFGGRFGGSGGPGPYGGSDGSSSPFGAAPEGIRGGGPGGPYGIDGPSRPFGGPGRHSRPSHFGSDGPSYRPGPFGGPSSSRNPFGSDGPSSSRSPFGSDGPSSSRNPFGSDGPPSSRNPFGGPSSRPGPFGSDSPSSRPNPFGAGGPLDRRNPFASDGPSSRPGSFGPDGPPSRSPFGGSDGPGSRPGNPFADSSDGPPSRSPFGSSDGPGSRPGSPFPDNSEGPSSRPGNPFADSSDGPSRPPFGSSGGPGPRPGYFGESSNSPYDGPEGPPSRPSSFGSFDGPPSGSYPGSDGPSRPFGAPPRHSQFGPPRGSRGGPDGQRSFGRPDSSAFSFVNSHPGSPGSRYSRDFPRHHPNQVQNDDYKEDDGDYSPFNNGPQRHSYPPRQQHAEYSQHEDYPHRGSHPSEGSRSRRPEHAPQQSFGLFGSTHRHDNPKRPIVLKVSGLKSNYMRELPPGPPIYYAPSPDMKPKDTTSRTFQDLEEKKSDGDYEEAESSLSRRAKSYQVKSRPKRDLEEKQVNSTSTTVRPPSPAQSCKSRRCTASASKKNNDRRRKPNPPKIMRIFNTTKSNASKSSKEDPMEADGTQQYWDVAASPYGVYNAYKKQDVHHALDRHDEYDHEGEEDEPVAPAVVARSSRRNHTYLDTSSDEQRFFPSFPAPPSPYLNPFASSGGFGRPPLFPGPTANRAPSRFHPQFGPKYSAPPPNRGPSSAYPAESHERYLHTNLLGSGNFEVVRGGTYYGDDDDGYHHSGNAGHYHHDENDDGYFHHNGHSSPHGYRNNPSAGGGDFFANFRDFADINPTRSFSHHVAVAEPHGSASHEQPKNILDKLESSSDKIEVHQPYTSSRDNDPMMATY